MVRSKLSLLFVLLRLVLSFGVLGMALNCTEEEDWKKHREEQREEEEERGEERSEDWFLLQNSRQVVRTDAGEMRVVKSFASKIVDTPMHIDFITMEPKSLFIPKLQDIKNSRLFYPANNKVPRYFPNCQIASRKMSFEFFGFTTSTHKNRRQFLLGLDHFLK